MILVDTNVLLDVVSNHPQWTSRLLPSNQRLAREFLDREQERYRKQLEQYAALMRALDKREIKLGLYFPLLRGWREWSPDRA